MKSIHFFCTKLRYFWTEIPLVAMLVISIYFNNAAKNAADQTAWDAMGVFKLYPFIIVCAAAVIFVLLYFFRMVSLSFQQVKDIGLFGDKDDATVEEGRYLLLTKKKGHTTELSLHCIDTEPALAWAKREPNEEPLVVRLFHSKLVGYRRPCRRILKYYGCSSADIEQVFACNGFAREYEKVGISSYVNECGEKTIRIDIRVTV